MLYAWNLVLPFKPHQPTADATLSCEDHMKANLSSLFALLLALAPLSVAVAAPPSTPQNLRPAFVTLIGAAPQATLLWESVPDALGYNVYRADDGNTNWLLVATNISVPFFHDPLFAALPSSYTVTAVNSDGEGSGADPVSVFEAEFSMVMMTPISPEYGTLSATNAVIHWATSWMEGDEALVEWGPYAEGSTDFPFFFTRTNYQNFHTFYLTNLSPLSPYQYRVTSISSTRGGLHWSGAFLTPDTNHPPVADVTAYPSGDGTNWVVRLTAADDDAYSYGTIQMNTFRITSQPTNGTLIGTLTESWYPAEAYLTYQPAPGARGADR